MKEANYPTTREEEFVECVFKVIEKLSKANYYK